MKSHHNRIIPMLAALLAIALPANSLAISRGTNPSDPEGRRVVATTTDQQQSQAAPPPILSFERNMGQTDSSVLFISRSGGLNSFLMRDSAVFVPRTAAGPSLASQNSDEASATPIRGRSRKVSPDTAMSLEPIRMSFAGASAEGGVTAETALEGKVNYLRGSDPAQWITDVPTFASIRYHDIYQGVDLVYYGNSAGELEYDFQLSPGADASQIVVTFDGANAMDVDPASGDLLVKTRAGELRHRAPVAFQSSSGRRKAVAAQYVLRDDRSVGVELGQHDRRVPVTIDPVITYSSYLGGAGDIDYPSSIAVDGAGNAYIAGSTNSADFPTVSPFDGTFGGDAFKYDAFVTKLNPAGTAIVYSTYLGGSGDDNGVGITVDATGQAYVAGFTDSTNFPTSAGTFQAARNGTAYDGFLTKLNASGSALVYSTYIGGTGNDTAYSVRVDGTGSAYIVGETASTNFPMLGAFQSTYRGGSSDAFVTRFNTAGTALLSSTYIGGAGDDTGVGIAIDTSGIYLSGQTNSSNFPTLAAAQGALASGGNLDAFVTKLTPAGSALAYSTYLGGTNYELSAGITIDSTGSAYIAGDTASTNFPTLTPFQAAFGGGPDDAFVTKLSPAGALTYSTYLGGSGTDYASSIAVDAFRRVHITGSTSSANFPLVASTQGTLGGDLDAFVAKLNEAGTALAASTYVGGASADGGTAITVDAVGSIFVAGYADSANFPVSAPFQSTRRGISDGFVLKMLSNVTVTGRVLTSSGAPLRGAIVTLSDPSGTRRQVSSSSLGFFTFENVEAGQTYTITVSSKRFRYSNVTFTPTENAVNFDLTGQE